MSKESYNPTDTSFIVGFDDKTFECEKAGVTDFLHVSKANDSVIADELCRGGVQFSVKPGSLSIIEYTCPWGSVENRYLQKCYNAQSRQGGAQYLQSVQIVRTKNDGTIKTIHQVVAPDKVLIPKPGEEKIGEKGLEKVWKFFCENLTWEDTEDIPEG
jgi:hypothetical protein